MKWNVISILIKFIIVFLNVDNHPLTLMIYLRQQWARNDVSVRCNCVVISLLLIRPWYLLTPITYVLSPRIQVLTCFTAGLLHWTHISDHVIEGHDLDEHVGMTPEACLQLCEDAIAECYSVDYNKITQTCYRNVDYSSAGASLVFSPHFDFYIHCEKRTTNGNYQHGLFEVGWL